MRKKYDIMLVTKRKLWRNRVSKNANIVAKNSMIILNFVTVNVKIIMKR